MPDRLTIHGKGGHGLIVAAAARLGGLEVRFTDGNDGTAPDPYAPAIIAIGDNRARQLNDSGTLVNVIHPTAFVDVSARLGRGVFIGPRAVVHVGARVGRGAIINTGAIVEHDCGVGDWTHLAPGAVLCGSVIIGEGTWVGANATVIHGVSIAPWTTIGAGAVVIRDITEPGTYVGNPARKIK